MQKASNSFCRSNPFIERRDVWIFLAVSEKTKVAAFF